MAYVDGGIVRAGSQEKCSSLSPHGAKVWREHDALEYRERIANDVKLGKWISFPQSVKLKPGEVVRFSWIIYKSRKDRDRIRSKVIKDKRFALMMDSKKDAVGWEMDVLGWF